MTVEQIRNTLLHFVRVVYLKGISHYFTIREVISNGFTLLLGAFIQKRSNFSLLNISAIFFAWMFFAFSSNAFAAIVAPATLSSTVVPISGLPTAPSYLTAIAGNRSVLLSWYPSEGKYPISGYLIYRGSSISKINDEPINLSPVTESNFNDSPESAVDSIENRRTYWYFVRAFDTDGRLSPASDIVFALPNGPLLPPGRVSAREGVDSISLDWSPPISTGLNELAGYKIFRGEASGSAIVPVGGLVQDTRMEDSSVIRGKPYFYVVHSVDSVGNTSEASPELRAIASMPPKPPAGVSALGVGDAVVRLKWNPAVSGGQFKVKGYNIFRASTAQILLTGLPINKNLIAGTRFEDSPEESTDPPKLGTNYHYAVVTVDEEGKTSGLSLASVAGPQASLTKIQTGDIQVGENNSLQIQGRKTINLSNTWVTTKSGQQVPTFGAGVVQGFQLDQQLQVRLTGKVGRKIKVDVDFDDKAPPTEQQKISVVYTGDQSETFKEFAFGDITMDLNSARTEFTGYNKNLFGAKVKLESPDSRLRLTAIAAQTKGYTETKRIVGGFEQAKTNNNLGRNIPDSAFRPRRHYYLSRDKDIIEGIDYIEPGSVQIYIDQPGITNQSGLNTVSVPDSTGTDRFNFVPLNAGSDFTIDTASGLVTFNVSIRPSDSIVVAYRRRRGDGSLETVGYDGGGGFDFGSTGLDSDVIGGKTSASRHMIQYGRRYPSEYDSHMSFQFYDMGNRDILNPQLDPDFKLVVYGSNNTPIYELDPRSNFSDVVEFDTRLGVMRFRTPFPFKKGLAIPQQLKMDSAFLGVEANFVPDQDDVYNFVRTQGNYQIHLEYKYKVSSFSLRFNIIRGSEVITLDGKRLRRDSDYFLDYETGILVFTNPDLLRENSVVEATYEYLPFGGQITSTMFGGRGEYDLSKSLSVGSTYIQNSSDSPIETPDIRSAPYSLQVLDGDIQAVFSRETIADIFSALPGLSAVDPNLKLTAKAESAHSWYKANTYAKNNETGVGMVDNFESVDDIVSTSLDEANWYPASRPIRYNGDTGMPRDDRMFSRVGNIQSRGHDAQQRSANNENPNRNMLQINYGGFDNAARWDAIVTPIQAQVDTFNKASYLEVWVKVDSAVTMNFDIGVVSEDSNDNGLLDAESLDGILRQGQDIGLNNALTLNRAYPLPGEAPGRYVNLNYWGEGNKRVDTEDLDSNNAPSLVNSFYRMSRVVQPSGATDTNGFVLVQIPLNSAQVLGSGNLSVIPGDTNYFSNVRHVRVWFTGAASSGGSIMIESIQFKGSKWVSRTDPGSTTLGGVPVTVASSKFQINAINRLNNATVAPSFVYVPNTNFFRIDSTGAEDREQALQVEYALTNIDQSNGRSNYHARRQLATSGDLDFAIYKFIRLDLHKPHATLPGETLKLRFGFDDANYFEYSVYLDQIGVASWASIVLALDGSDGRRVVVGQPSLRRIKYAYLSVLCPNSSLNTSTQLIPNGGRELLWLNNLRLTDAETREGTASKVNLNYDFADGKVVINQDMREVDSDFVRIDQQANDPIRHDRSHTLSGNISAVPGIPMTGRWQERSLTVDPSRISDPKYSRNFQDPNERISSYGGTLGFSLIPRVALGSSGSLDLSRREFLPAYVASQRSLLSDPRDKVVNPNYLQSNLALHQDATYRVHPQVPWLADDEIRFDVNYDETKVEFDTETGNPLTLVFKNSQRRTRTIKGRYSGQYRWGSILTLSPSYAYGLTEAQGNVPISSSRNPYYVLGPDRVSQDYVMQSKVISPQLGLQFDRIPGLRTPRINYIFTQTRDYVRNELRAPGSLDVVTSLQLEDWIGVKVPSVDFNQNWSVDSVINNDVRIRGVERSGVLREWLDQSGEFGARYAGYSMQNIPSIALLEQQNPLQSAWWVRIDNPTFGENTKDPLHIENLAVTASRRSSTSFSTSFDIPFAPGWTGRLSPRTGMRGDRTMSAPEQVTRQEQFSVGSGLVFREPKILFSHLLKYTELNLNYDYSTVDTFDAFDQLTINRLSNTFRGLLPAKPTDRTALTFGFNWAGSLDTNYSYFGLSRQEIQIERNSYEPSVRLAYFLTIDKRIRLYDFWPFNGRELVIKQSFKLDNDLFMTIRRDKQRSTRAVPDVSTELYTLRNQLSYNLLENVSFRFLIEQKMYQDHTLIEQVNDFYSFKLELGLEATF